MKHVCMFLANKEASESGLTSVPNSGEFGGNCAVRGAPNSNVANYELGHTRTYWKW